MKQKRILLCVVLCLMVFNVLIPVLYAQQPLSEMSEEERNKKVKDAIGQHRKEKEKTRHPKVSSLLTDLEDEYNKGAEEAAKKFNAGEVLQGESGAVISNLEDAKKKGGGDAAKAFAKKRGINSNGEGVSVEIFLKQGITSDIFDKSLLEAYGCDVELSDLKSERILAHCPINKLRDIADGVEEIYSITPYASMAIPLSFRSEGLNKVGFSNYSAAGINGSGVKVAVIDLGFKGLSSAISNGDLPGSLTK